MLMTESMRVKLSKYRNFSSSLTTRNPTPRRFASSGALTIGALRAARRTGRRVVEPGAIPPHQLPPMMIAGCEAGGMPRHEYVGPMRRFEIAPALEPEEWKQRRCGAVSINHDAGDTYVVVCDPDGAVVTVSGSAEVFALMALANDALPDGDPRKLTRRDVDWLRTLASETEMFEAIPMREWAARMARVLNALLPP